MPEKTDWKLVIEDARTRHAAVVNLIYFTDSQAMNLLRLYVTVASAFGTVGSHCETEKQFTLLKIVALQHSRMSKTY